MVTVSGHLWRKGVVRLKNRLGIWFNVSSVLVEVGVVVAV
jgi:hypothetical protein